MLPVFNVKNSSSIRIHAVDMECYQMLIYVLLQKMETVPKSYSDEKKLNDG